MRISTLQTFNNAVNQMQKGQTNLALTQQKIASGKELLRPSDDPVAAAQILKLNREVARIEKFEENIEVTDRRLQLEEMTLEQIDTAADRVKELTIQAGNATLSDTDREFIASEVRQLQEQMLALMNTKDTAGEYLFAGNRGFTPPFVKNGDTFEYQGDDGQRIIQVGPELRVASTDSGRDVFQVIPEEIGVRALGAQADVSSFSVSVTDPEEETFQTFSETNGDVVFRVTAFTAGPPDTYDYAIEDGSGNTLTTASNVQTGVDQEFGGLTFSFNGTAAPSGPVTLRAEQENRSLLQTMEDLITALELPQDSPETREAYQESLAKVHEELAVAKEGNLKVRTALGARMNSVEAAAEANADLKLFTETALSQLQDLDYGRAISEFSLQETALQAAQATFSRISKLSLFNYL